MPVDQTPPLTAAELDALEAAAKAATPGPWRDAYIAAAKSAMVLRLVADVRRLRAAIAAPAALVQAAEAVLLSAAKGGQGHAMDLLALERAVAKALQTASPAVELPREATPGTVRVRVAVYRHKGEYVVGILEHNDETPSDAVAVLVADVPLPPVVQARVEPVPEQEGGAT